MEQLLNVCSSCLCKVGKCNIHSNNRICDFHGFALKSGSPLRGKLSVTPVLQDAFVTPKETPNIQTPVFGIDIVEVETCLKFLTVICPGRAISQVLKSSWGLLRNIGGNTGDPLMACLAHVQLLIWHFQTTFFSIQAGVGLQRVGAL